MRPLRSCHWKRPWTMPRLLRHDHAAERMTGAAFGPRAGASERGVAGIRLSAPRGG